MILNELEKGEYTIITPEGFIGRPWDTVYELRETVIDELYHITFTGGVKFTFDRTNQFHFFKSSLFIIIEQPSLLKLGVETVLNRRIELKRFERGIVSFINVKDSQIINDIFEFKNSLVAEL